MDKLNVKLEVFEGPLDLLLYLIKENKMDIYDIKVSVITAQYIAMLDMMTKMDMDIATEFMVMAATLMYIKSKMLLPAETVSEDDIDVEDPRRDLVSQLLEYKIFKKIAELLAEKEAAMAETYRRDVSKEMAMYVSRELLFDTSFYELLDAFRDLMERVNNVAIHEVVKEDYKVEDKIRTIQEWVGNEEPLRVSDLLKLSRNKLEMVVYVLAVLELARLKEIKIMQNEVFGEIWIYKTQNRLSKL
ncbi:MAG TPA: chromosome segregation protein ScpA [Firmicutes bacterium]|nr:chromosome segregation protein ScpA [Bacillota bacterium]